MFDFTHHVVVSFDDTTLVEWIAGLGSALALALLYIIVKGAQP
jgi:hypothetical protein